jgi:DNA topoisomerase-6 subunit A
LSKQKSKTTAEARKDKVEKVLNSLGHQVYDDLENSRFPSVSFASRSVSNIVYDKKLQQFVLGSASVKRSAGNIKHIRPFTQLLWLAYFSRKLVEEKKTSTLRDVYYSAQAFDVEFVDQAESDELITDLEVLLGSAREEFNVYPEERSAIFGNMTIEYTVPGYEGKTLDLSAHPDGMMIGPAMTTAEFRNTDAEMVLAIEKGGLFTRFIEEKVHEKYKAILINTAGQPPRATRYLLRRLHSEMKLPVGILCDADPWGAHIAMVIKSGSANAAHLRDLTTPTGVWLGVWASVTGDEPIFIERNGYIRNEPVSKIYDSVVGPNSAGNPSSQSLRAASCSELGEVKVDPVNLVTKHGYRGDLYEIRTRGGYTVKTTGNHSIQVFNQSTCELESVRVDSLRKGDIVASCLTLPDNQQLTRINLAELILSECPELADDIFVEGEEAERFSAQLKARYNKKILRQYFYQVLKRDAVKLSYYRAEGKTPQTGHLRLRYSKNRLPIIIDSITEFARLLGYYAAEGGLSNGTEGGGCELTFNLEERKYAADAKRCMSKTLGVRARVERREHSMRIRFGGTLLARMFSLVLKTGLGARDRQIPFVVYNIPDQGKKEFLRGYFRGDRMINYNEGTRLSAKTVSRKLASDLVVLLKQLGAVASVWKSGKAFVVAASGASISEIVQELCRRHVDFESDLRALPGEALYSVRDSMKGLAQPGKKSEMHVALFTGGGRTRVGFNRVERALETIERHPQDVRLRRLLSFMRSGIALLPITEIRNLGRSEDYVYDLEVADTHTFIGGLGGLVLHNSDIQKYKLPSDPLTEIDIKRVYELKADPRYKEKLWHDELDTFLKNKRKSEQEAFSRYGLSYIVDKYLPDKLELLKN